MQGFDTTSYLNFHKEFCDEARELSRRKNNDYADPEAHKNDPYRVFSNFRLCEQLGIVSTEQGFLVRLSDKFSRLCSLLEPDHTQTVTDESLEDTMKDILNYTILLAAYLRNKKSLELSTACAEKKVPENITSGT